MNKTILNAVTAAVSNQSLGMTKDESLSAILLAGTFDGATVALSTRCPVTKEFLPLDGCEWREAKAYPLQVPKLLDLYVSVSGGGASQNITGSIR